MITLLCLACGRREDPKIPTSYQKKGTIVTIQGTITEDIHHKSLYYKFLTRGGKTVER
jgi:hypothetical protein